MLGKRFDSGGDPSHLVPYTAGALFIGFALVLMPAPRHDLWWVVAAACVAAAVMEHAHAIEVDTPNELVATMDTEAFERILSNLVSNALRYGSAPIGVSARAEGEALVVVVTDHGPGVPSEFIPDLFQRFTRSDAGRQRAPGTGLGLAIARSYADAHGGTLTYTGSEREGARFVLRLPRFGASTGHAAPLAQLAPASVS